VTVTDKIRYKIVAWGFAAGLALTAAVAIPAVQERMEFNRVAESQQPNTTLLLYSTAHWSEGQIRHCLKVPRCAQGIALLERHEFSDLRHGQLDWEEVVGK
jgi:hypothetical protein